MGRPGLGRRAPLLRARRAGRRARPTDAHWRRFCAASNDERTLGAFLKHLLERDLSGFDIRQVPQTAALDDQKQASFTTEERWLIDLLDKGVSLESYQNTGLEAVPWQAEIPTDSLAAAYETYCYLHGTARYAMHRVQLGAFLAKYYERVRLSPPKTGAPKAGAPKAGAPRPWGYRFGPLNEARARFCEVQTIAVDWGGRS